MNEAPLSIRVARVIITAVGVLFVAITALVLVIATSLAVPGTALDRMWLLKPGSRDVFDTLGLWGILLLLVVGGVALATGIGLLRRRRWARWVAAVGLALNAVPDLVQGFLGRPEILIAAVPVALIAVYLALPVVGRALQPRADGREN
jgi:hypothetical protein